MRPVNLIPPEERRGDRAPSRTGALPYVLVGVLVIALAMVTLMTLTGKKISEKENEVAALEVREAEASARAEALRPYAEFAALSAARDATVTSLAQSRFDWERVLRELALVIPDDVWLTQATGTVSPEVQIEGGATIDGRDEIPGPALALIGCGANQDAVAGFIAALRDIDGVTRVGVAKSERNETSADTSVDGAAAAPSAGTDCRTRDPIARFEILAAFDAVPTPPAAEPVPAPGAVPAAPTSTSSASAPTGDQVSDGYAQEQQARDSATEQIGEAQEATNIVPGVAR